MKAVFIEQHGGADVLRYADFAEPVAAAGQALVKVAAAGVNFIDTYQRTGLYKIPLPFVLGMEGAGTIAALGEGVTGLRVGDPVAWAMSRGSYAEYAAVPAHFLVKVPAGIDLRQAAAAMLQGMTAHYLTHSTFPIEPGHVALVHAAAGGTGRLISQMIKLREEGEDFEIQLVSKGLRPLAGRGRSPRLGYAARPGGGLDGQHSGRPCRLPPGVAQLCRGHSGQAYRCNHPTPGQLARHGAALGHAHVINLRGPPAVRLGRAVARAGRGFWARYHRHADSKVAAAASRAHAGVHCHFAGMRIRAWCTANPAPTGRAGGRAAIPAVEGRHGG